MVEWFGRGTVAGWFDGPDTGNTEQLSTNTPLTPNTSKNACHLVRDVSAGSELTATHLAVPEDQFTVQIAHCLVIQSDTAGRVTSKRGLFFVNGVHRHDLVGLKSFHKTKGPKLPNHRVVHSGIQICRYRGVVRVVIAAKCAVAGAFKEVLAKMENKPRIVGGCFRASSRRGSD